MAKELGAYEKEWELTRRERIDTLLMEIERAEEKRDARGGRGKVGSEQGA